MKHTYKLNESELHRIIKESVKRILKESYGDDDYASTGDPYGFGDTYEHEEPSLDGVYGSFNNISVEIKGDATNNPYIKVESKDGKVTQELQGREAADMLEKIKANKDRYGDIHYSIYRNLARLVLDF